jgi:hypothetical protein
LSGGMAGEQTGERNQSVAPTAGWCPISVGIVANQRKRRGVFNERMLHREIGPIVDRHPRTQIQQTFGVLLAWQVSGQAEFNTRFLFIILEPRAQRVSGEAARRWLGGSSRTRRKFDARTVRYYHSWRVGMC